MSTVDDLMVRVRRLVARGAWADQQIAEIRAAIESALVAERRPCDDAPPPKCKPLSFDEAWSKKEAEGYRYGRDALEQVRFGWKMCEHAHGISDAEREKFLKWVADDSWAITFQTLGQYRTALLARARGET